MSQWRTLKLQRKLFIFLGGEKIDRLLALKAMQSLPTADHFKNNVFFIHNFVIIHFVIAKSEFLSSEHFDWKSRNLVLK